MKTSSKIYISLFAITLVVLGYFWLQMKKRTSSEEVSATHPQNISKESEEIDYSTSAEKEDSGNEDDSDSKEAQPADESLEEVPDSEPDPAEKSKEFLEVTRYDCESECEDFDIGEDLKYCQQVCGLTSLEKDRDCYSLSGLEKDYCLKNLAIKDNDGKICDQIEDANIKKTCQNRVLEDFVDEQIINSRQTE